MARAVLIFVVLLAITTPAAAVPNGPGKATLKVGAKPKTWRSPAYDHPDALEDTDLRVNGKLVTGHPGDCWVYFDDHGVTAKLDFCGSRVVLRVANVRGKTVKVTLTYRVVTAIEAAIEG